MSRFLAYINKGTEADHEFSSESVQAILHESALSDVTIETFSHDCIHVAYTGNVSVHLDESLGLLIILSGYFRRSGFMTTYSDDAKDLLPMFAENADLLKDDFEGCFSLVVCHLSSLEAWLMTDRFGTKPLYYIPGERHVAVSSETCLLLPWTEKLSISPAALTDSFWLGFCRAPHSMISGVVKAPDNSVVSVSSDRATESHVKPCPLVIEPDETLDFESVVTRVENALEQEFASLGRTANRVAVLLSGGVDSSIMAAYAQDHFAECVAYSCNIEGYDNPELERAVYVAKKLGMRHEIVGLNLDQLDGVFSEVVSMLEGPSRHINNIVVRRIFQEIQGVDAIIGGDGADAVFGTKTNRTIRNIEHKIALVNRVPAFFKPILAMILERMSPGKRTYLKRILANDLEWLLGNLFTVEYGEEQVTLAGKLGISQFSGIPLSAYKASDNVGKSLEANISLFLRCMLERNSKLSNDSNIPVYYPFLSEGMLRISRGLPYKHRFDDAGNAKPALREICRRCIDSSVIGWPKIGFETPEKAWLTKDLKPYLDRVLSNEGGISKVLGVTLDSDDIEIAQSSTRILWWLITLDSSLLAMEARFLGWKQK